MSAGVIAPPADVQLLPISVIMPTFGRNEFARRALRSVVTQTRPPREIIVVDDGSVPPVSVSDVQTGPIKLLTVRHESNLGAAAARNTGIRHAGSEWITFLDSDDLFLPVSLERRWTAIATQRSDDAAENVVYGCGWTDVDGTGLSLGTRIPRPADTLAQWAAGCWYSPGTCILLRRDHFLKAGIWQDESLRRFEDYDWSIQLGTRGFSLKILPVIGAAITRHRGQDPAKVEPVAARIVEKWRERALDYGTLRRIEAYISLECAAANYHAGRMTRAGAFLARSFLSSPRLSLHLSPGWSRSSHVG